MKARRLLRGAVPKRIGLAGILVTIAGVWAVPVSAQASPAGPRIEASKPSVGSQPALLPISCTPSVDNPHKSTHVPTMVNIEGSVVCNEPVTSLSMTMYLDSPTDQLYQSRAFVNYGQLTLSGNLAVPCVSGVWEGFNEAFVTFPPGYYPPTGNGVSNPTYSKVTC
jgi:hypothetical protein